VVLELEVDIEREGREVSLLIIVKGSMHYLRRSSEIVIKTHKSKLTITSKDKIIGKKT
jgi:hypothetical protein